MPGTGAEHIVNKPDFRHVSKSSAVKSAVFDPDLQSLSAIWGILPAEIREQIITIAKRGLNRNNTRALVAQARRIAAS